jgi:hypothetical protein
VVATLGIHTARVLLRRALWQTAQRHPAIAFLQQDDCGLSFDTLEMSYPTRPRKEVEGYAIWPQEDVEAALFDLCAEMLLILARLRGGEMARRMGTGHSGPRQVGMYCG